MLSDELLFEFYDGYADESNFLDKMSNTMGASEFLPSASNTDAFFHYDGSSSADTTPSHMLSPYVKANAPAGSWLVRSAAGDTAPFDNSCSLATVRPAETEGEGGQGVVGSAKAAWLSEDDRGFGTGTSTVVDETPLYTSIFRDELARQTGIGLPNDKCSEVPADSLDFADLLDHPAKRAATDRRRSELAAPADAPACSRAMVRHISAPVAASPLEGAEPLPGSHPPLLPAPIPPFIERVLSAPCACATGSAASGLAKAPWAQSGAPVAEGLSGNHVVQALGSRGAHTFGDLSVSRQGVVLTSTPGTTATTRSPLPSHSGDMPGVFPGCARPPFAALQQELLRLSDASRRLGYAPQGTIQHLEAQAMAAANAVSAMGSVFPFEGVQFTNDKLGLLSVGSTDCTGGILNSTRLAEETMAQGPHSVEQRFSSLGLPLGGRVRGGTPDSPAWLRTHNAPAPASSCVGGSEGAASQMSTVPSVARPGSVGGAPSPSPASSAIGSLPSSSVAARDEAAHPAPTAFKWVSGVGAGITPPLPAKAQPARLDGLAREAAAAADAAAAAQAAAAARGPRSLSNASANGTDTQANVAHNANVAAAAAAAAASRLMHAEAEACSQARGSGSKSVAVNRKAWSPEEDETIRACVRAMGMRWRLIAPHLPGRSDDSVRNRWKRLKEEEDQSWANIGAANDSNSGRVFMDGAHHRPAGDESTAPTSSPAASHAAARRGARSAEGAVNEDGDDPQRPRTSWSAEEDEIIVSAVRDLGPRWCAVAARLPSRTDQAIRNRWNRLQQRARVQARQAQNMQAFLSSAGMSSTGLPSFEAARTGVAS